MPTIIAHAAVPICLSVGLGSKAVPPRLLLAGMAAAMFPDLDVVAFKLGIPYEHAFGHRGMSHSLLVAALVGMLFAAFTRQLRASFAVVFMFVAISAASHGLLDTLTDGGLGAALLWPLSDQRLFAPVRPIEVSPLGVSFLFSARGWAVLRSEMIFVWLPALLFALGLLAVRRGGRHR